MSVIAGSMTLEESRVYYSMMRECAAAASSVVVLLQTMATRPFDASKVSVLGFSWLWTIATEVRFALSLHIRKAPEVESHLGFVTELMMQSLRLLVM